AREMRVAREEVGGLDAAVGEVAAPAAGDADLLGQLGGVVEQQHATTALAGLTGTHHAGGAGADHDDVEGFEAGQGSGRDAGNAAGYALVHPPANGGRT